VNVYLAEDVLIDAGTRWDRGRIFAEIEGRQLLLLALTHVHPDHQGVAKDVCEARDIPLACHADDVEAMEGRRPVQEAAPNNPFNRIIKKIWQGPPHAVGRVLSEGDEVAGFRVIHAPGHARGEVIFFRDSDRVAICGDVIRNMSYATGLPGIKEPPEIFTYDPPENRRSIRQLAELEPRLILPGHGPAVTDMAAFERFVAALPA
jgi:hydroxyacylglutathione hydrolase